MTRFPVKIKYRSTLIQFCTIVFISSLLTGLSAQSDPSPQFPDPESMVRHLYDQVTFDKDNTPDWHHIRTLFIPNATIVMRTSREETTTLTLDGWILDFVNFIHDRDITSTGFEEKVIKVKSMVFGDIAQVLVLYTSFIPSVTKSPREGVDSFHLVRQEGTWKIVSILNEIPGPDRPSATIFR